MKIINRIYRNFGWQFGFFHWGIFFEIPFGWFHFGWKTNQPDWQWRRAFIIYISNNGCPPDYNYYPVKWGYYLVNWKSKNVGDCWPYFK